jgi:hypothetical protein
LKIKPVLCCLAITFAIDCPAAVVAPHSYDVVVVGAGTGGVSAAIQAARMGAHVALLEETDWIGGQMAAAAVSTMDEGGKLKGPQGIYDEFLQRIGAYYAAHGKAVGTCYYHNTSHCYEPAVIQKVLYELIADANHTPRGKLLDVFLRHRVVQVLANGRTVTGVVTQSGERFDAKVVIDATEYGDLLPLSPAPYRSGNNISTLPSHPSCTQFITYVAVIKKYPAGVPDDLVMHHAPPGYDGSFVDHMKSLMQLDGSPGTRALPVSFEAFVAYRAIPDSASAGSYVASDLSRITKTSIDWFNDYPATTEIFNRVKRKDIVCRAKLKTLDVLYFIQHELKESSWSVANDEGFDTPYNREDNSCPNIPAEYKAIERNFPVMPYIRESQRVVGVDTLTSISMHRETNALSAGLSNSIALGDYSNDLHGCAQEQDMETDLEHAGDRADAQAFQVPEGALIPRDVNGLLVAEKNLSQSRLANGSSRLQPITMVTGQAAGALAALSVQQSMEPRQISVAALQRVLLRADSSLSLNAPPDVVPRTDLWQAAQFVVVHDWMAPKVDNTFGFDDVLTRQELAETLARTFALTNDWDAWWSTFGHSALVQPDELVGAPPSSAALYQQSERWRHDQTDGPKFNDVPLYGPYASFIESVAIRGAMLASPNDPHMFFPLAPATEAELTHALRVLSASTPSAISPQDGASLKQFDDARPLTKGVAAKMLYWFATRSSLSQLR